MPAANLVALPAGVPLWQGALLEPLAVGLNMMDRLRISLGETVVILGQGPIGLAQTRLAALSGAARLIVTDVRDEVFGVARGYGATDCVNVARDDVRDAVADLTGGGPDIVIETSGFPDAVAAVPDLVRKEGRVGYAGFAADLPDVPLTSVILKTLTIYGVGGNGGRGQYERAVELVSAGRVPLRPMVTHTFDLLDAARAFDVAATKADGAIKVVLGYGPLKS